MSETQEYQDPDDIFRDIDLDNEDDVIGDVMMLTLVIVTS